MPGNFIIDVVGCYVAQGQGVASSAVGHLDLTLEGIVGERHSGFTRKAGAREPWYPRGTIIRNERQLTIVSCEDLTKIAKNLGIEKILPEWIGANILVENIDKFTQIPYGARMFLPSGAALVLCGENQPCRFSGAEIARHYPDYGSLDLKFVSAAKHLRGLIACVERPGIISTGDSAKMKFV